MIPLDATTAEQIKYLKLGDSRLNKRAQFIFSRLDEMGPENSFPSIFKDGKELKGFYRLVNNPSVGRESIFAGYQRGLVSLAKTDKRLMKQSRLYLFQDTTYGKYHNRKGLELGYLETGWDNGVVLHNGILTDGEFNPLGIPVQEFIVRDHADFGKRHKRKDKPFEQKESYKWVSSIKWAKSFEKQTGKQVVQVADREADIAELFNYAIAQQQAFIIRAQWNRRLKGPGQKYFFDFMHSQQAQGTATVALLDERGKKHEVECALSYASVQLEEVEAPLQAIWLKQLQPYEGQKETASYMLLTSLPIQSTEQAREILHTYVHRWRTCEDFHKCLKTGCAIEERQFENVHALQNSLAILSLMAIRLLRMRHLAQVHPHEPVGEVLKEEEIPLAEHLANKYLKPSDLTVAQKGTVFWWVLLLGRLGGHQGFKQKGMPGWQTLWKGWLYFQTLQEGINLSKNFVPT